MKQNHLIRFLDAQNNTYKNALKEIKTGQKTGHWIGIFSLKLKDLDLLYLTKQPVLRQK